jgi:carboxypeptidase family protein
MSQCGFALRMRRLLAVVSFLLVLTTCLPFTLNAQVLTTGKITGVVTDASGAVVANATITAKGVALFAPRATTSHADGSYLLDLLPPGEYELTVGQSGFRTFTQTGIVLNAGFTATVNPKLQVGEVSQVVNVEAESAVVDLQSNQTTTTFDQNLLQEIPSGRDPWSTVAQIPGAVAGTFDVAGNNSYQQSSTQIHGSTPSEQIYSYNGLNLNWPGFTGGFTQFYTNHDSFEEFQVVSDNAPASVPIGGVYMNQVTKSGSNTLHGLAAIYYLTARTQADVDHAVFNGQPTDFGFPFDMARDTTASLGGPLIRDRWWLFGSYRRYDLRQSLLSVRDQAGNPVPDVNHQTNTDLRSDWQINSKNKFSFIWLYNEQNRLFRRDTAFAFVTKDASWKQIEPAYVLQGLWTSQVNTNLVLDFRVGWNKLVFPLRYQDDSTGLNKQDIAFSLESGAAPNQSINPAWVLRWSASGSWYKGNLAGSHNFQFGYEWGKANSNYINKVSQGINAVYNSVGPQGTLPFTTPSLVIAFNTPTNQKNYFQDMSFYVQDTWNMRRLTFNLGVRFDRFRTYFPQQTTDPNLLFPTLFAAGTFPASGDLVNWNTVSPRIGVSFDPTGKGTSVLRFGFGVYHALQGTALSEFANPNGGQSLTFPWAPFSPGCTACDANNDLIPQDSEWLPPGQTPLPVSQAGFLPTDRHAKRPYSIEISGGYEKQLLRDLRIGATYYYRTKRNLLGAINKALLPTDYAPITTLNGQPIVNGLTGQPLTLFSPSHNAFDFEVTNIPKLDDNAYHGVEFTAVKRLSNKWQLLSGFTIQRQKGSFGNGFADFAFSDNFNDPNNDINRKNNYLNSDSTYIFKLDSSYELPWKIGTSANFQHYTGFPIRPTETFTGPELNQTSVTIGAAPAGALRYPTVNQLNLRLSREFTFNERWHLTPTVDFFNVTNAQTIIGEVTTVGNSFRLPFLAINPFVTRFALRLTF